MFNIDLDEKELEILINKLETNNKTIVDTLNIIYQTITEIDDIEWHSQEKDRLNNDFIPYLKRQETNVNVALDSKIAILKKALALYREKNQVLTKDAEKLEVL